MDLRKVIVVAALSGLSFGCNSATAHLSDDSYDVAMAERFGRMDIVTGSVNAKRRDDFIAAHAAWGSSIRIVDLEYAGMSMAAEDKALVQLIVAWQRIDESTLRTTTLMQTWVRGDHWEIFDERRVGGDKGLLDEPDSRFTPDAKSPEPKVREISSSMDR